MKVGDVICVMDLHDLWPRQVRDFVGNLFRTLSQSRHNGIWALQNQTHRCLMYLNDLQQKHVDSGQCYSQ